MSNFISEFFDSVGDTLTDAWHAVEANPIGVLVTIAGAEFGLPPIYAGALGGAAGAAAAGGSTNQILKASLTGGAMAYIGGQASSAAGGGVLGAAAGGAATGAAISAIQGGNLKSNIWNGLVIGTTVGGIQQIMTTQEAISSVPKDVMAAANASSDPMGTLINKMGWTPGNGAISAAGQATANYQNDLRDANLSAEQKAYNQTQVKFTAEDALSDPNIQKYVYEAQLTNDPAAALAEKLGYSTNSTVATDAMAKVLLDPSVQGYNPLTVPPAAQAIVDTGMLSNAEAVTLSDAGYTAADVNDLLKAGYNAGDLVDMASTGVPASTLKSLANTQFSESTINDLLTKSNISANEIAQASNLVNSGKLSVTTAESLMSHGVNTLDLPSIANSGKADQFAKLLNSGVDRANAQYMLDKGVDLTKANQMIDSGKITSQQIDDSFSNNTYGKTINEINNYTTPVAPTTTTTTTPTGPTAPVNPYESFAQSHNFDFTTGDPTQLADQYGQQYSQDQIAAREANMTAAQKATMESRISLLGGTPEQLETAASSGNYNDFLKKMGWSTDNAYTREAYQRGLDSYTGQQQAQTQFDSMAYNAQHTAQPVNPNLVDVGGGNYMDQSGNITDVNGNITHPAITPSNPVTETASYTPEQEALYNHYIQQGMTPQQAMSMLENSGQITTETPTKVDVGGSAGYAGNPSGVVQEYRTPGTDLATQEQIDNKTATYNAGANAWEVPSQPTEEPYIPTPQPVAPNDITYSNVISANGTTYNIDHYSDGSVKYTDTGNGGTGSTAQEATQNGQVTQPASPTTGTGGTTTGTGTPVTTPVQPPLTPPVQEVIPPSEPIPEVKVPETPTEPVTPETPTEPTTPEPPYIPVTPIIPPTTTTPPVLHGVSNIGPGPKINTPTGLNAGWITNVPTYYNNPSAAADQYYWGQHPLQPGPKFNPELYNQIPNAPVEPFGATYAQTSATPADILAAMQGRYPLLNTTTVNGPVIP